MYRKTMDKVEENEELAARARAYGRDDLAEQYESVAARWRYLYEEAEDEEMECSEDDYGKGSRPRHC